MLISVDSSLKTFKRVEFHEGLNVLLSDSHPDAGDKHTRNSAGKTSLVEIIHFLLGADCDKDSIFRTDELIEHSFNVEFDFRGERIWVERSGSAPSKIYVLAGLDSREDLPIKSEKETGKNYIANENWKTFLGHILFGLPEDPSGTAFGESYTPSFRSMISYFVRRNNSRAFLSPERQAEKQQRWDWQENLSYLLGFDWRIPYEFQGVKARENVLEELKKAAKGGALGDVIGSVAELRPKVTVAERKAAQRREQLNNFKVLDSYNDLAREAARAKTEMQAISRDIVGLRETLNYLEAAVSAEVPPAASHLEQMYAAAGVQLPGVALKKLEEVQRFYESVVQNRALHLRTEITDISDKISRREAKISELDVKRQGIIKTLESSGALEDFVALQKGLADLEAEAASLRERFKAAEVLEGEKTQLEIDRANLLRRLQHDFRERKEQLDRIILLVADIIAELYDDRSGSFEIRATDRGPEFKISIEGDRGGGIANMEIFCFDLALFSIVSSEQKGPGFLVHDSHLFDGVDERQIARALALGRAKTEGKSLQYIVTMNSDIFNRLPLPSDMDWQKPILKTRLSDEDETGGLFGFRF